MKASLQVSRRDAMVIGAVAAMGLAPRALADAGTIFDGHFHIIDPAFPLIPNQGYIPPPFTIADYREVVRPLHIRGGAVVSASFQGFDQTYLEAALSRLGPGYVGVAQVPGDVRDDEIRRLDGLGVRALRFNLYRGPMDGIDDLMALARRAHAVAGWHAELYADAATLKPHVARLATLPQVCIDHLGMTEAGLPVILDLVAAGAKVKATGFGRVSMDIPRALETIASASPGALVFGTDLPSTRAERPFAEADIGLITRVLGPELATRVFRTNGRTLYRLPPDAP